jgi:hypothetical protein
VVTPCLKATELEATTAIKIVSKSQSRFNYKCKYCCGEAGTFTTKFKAHIIEHMQIKHRLCLMECPEVSCRKRFKDEWKLKRHLLSNREHGQLVAFKSLHDVMRQHVEVTPQKVGFPCPFCRVDQSSAKGK